MLRPAQDPAQSDSKNVCIYEYMERTFGARRSRGYSLTAILVGLFVKLDSTTLPVYNEHSWGTIEQIRAIE